MGRARDRASADLNGQEFILDADADTSISADTDDQIDIRIGGADDFAFKANKFEVQTGSNIDMNGTELILDADADSSITADTDDQIDIKVGGTDTIKIEPDAVTILGPHPDLNLQDSDDNNTGGVYYNDGRITLASDNGAQHSGSSLVLSVDGTARMTVDDGGDVDIETGDIFFSTAGKGINLGVTSNTDSNTLDDYEEGTFTTGFTFSTSGSISLNASYTTMRYTKVGRLVTVNGDLRLNGASSPTGALRINVPFTSQDTSAGIAAQLGLLITHSVAKQTGQLGNMLVVAGDNLSYITIQYETATTRTGGSAENYGLASGDEFLVTIQYTAT